MFPGPVYLQAVHWQSTRLPYRLAALGILPADHIGMEFRRAEQI
jgi:hypothetical protein